MRKDLKKNKKGFTLVEIIVVLLIIGILLAITIPSIMGYVNKAKEAQYIADARSGYVAAQTITARNVAKGVEDVTGKTEDQVLASKITEAEVAKELGEETKATEEQTIKSIKCTVENKNIKACTITTKDSPSGKVINFEARKDAVMVPEGEALVTGE